MNLKQEFDTLILEELTPVMKELGFTKQNLNYHRNTGEVIQTFNIQKSEFNDKNSLKFTGNIGLTEPISYSKINNFKTTPKQIKEYESQFRIRLGNLTDNVDYWYEIRDNFDFTPVKKKFISDMEILKHFLENYKSRNSLLELIKNMPNSALLLNPLDHYGILKVSGKEEEAKALIIENFKYLKEPSILGKVIKWIRGMISDREISLELIREQRQHYKEIASLFGDTLN